MNFEFIDLSLDDRQFKGETHNKNLEDAMKQAIVNFCKSMDTGLFLLDMPTGFGKTYSVLDFMVDNYDAPEFKDKKIFFVTPLRKICQIKSCVNILQGVVKQMIMINIVCE